MMSPEEMERRIRDLERRVPSGPMVSTSYGAEVRPFQTGFPVRLTSVYNGTTGYSWEQLVLSREAPGVTTMPAYPRTGSYAWPVNNDDSYQVGDRGWLEVDPQARGWLFIPVDVTISRNSTGTGTGTGSGSGTGDGAGCEIPAEDAETDYADPWVLVDVSECWDEEEIWTWARQRVVCGADGVVRLQYYGYRTEIHCCVPCGDHTGTGDADGSGTGTGDPCQGYCSEYEVAGITLTRWWPDESDPTANHCYWRGTSGSTTYVLYISNTQWGLINGDPGEATKGWTSFGWDGNGTETFVPTTLGGNSNGNIDVTCTTGSEVGVETGCEFDPLPATLYLNFGDDLAPLGVVRVVSTGGDWVAPTLPDDELCTGITVADIRILAITPGDCSFSINVVLSDNSSWTWPLQITGSDPFTHDATGSPTVGGPGCAADLDGDSSATVSVSDTL